MTIKREKKGPMLSKYPPLKKLNSMEPTIENIWVQLYNILFQWLSWLDTVKCIIIFIRKYFNDSYIELPVTGLFTHTKTKKTSSTKK